MKKYPLARSYFSLGFILFSCYQFIPVYADPLPVQSATLKPEDWNGILETRTRAAEATPWYTPERIAQMKEEDATLKDKAAAMIAASMPTEVTVTEKIPGMECESVGGSGPDSKKYKCKVEPGFGSVMLILKGIIKYATFITALIGVLMLVVSGIQYSIAGADKSAADDAKKRIQKVLAGIILLFLIGFILNSVAPWIYR